MPWRLPVSLCRAWAYWKKLISALSSCVTSFNIHILLAFIIIIINGAVVERLSMRTQHRGYQFDSSMYHFQNAVGEKGNRKPPHKIHFPVKTQSPVSGFCYARNRICNAVLLVLLSGCVLEPSLFRIIVMPQASPHRNEPLPSVAEHAAGELISSACKKPPTMTILFEIEELIEQHFSSLLIIIFFSS